MKIKKERVKLPCLYRASHYFSVWILHPNADRESEQSFKASSIPRVFKPQRKKRIDVPYSESAPQGCSVLPVPEEKQARLICFGLTLGLT